MRKMSLLGFVHYSVSKVLSTLSVFCMGLNYAKNALAAGASPQTPLVELATLP